MIVTKEWLEDHEACRDQVKVFVAEWPDGAELTLENLRRAADIGLSIDWLACKIFDRNQLDEYDHATDPEWAEYQRALAPARAEYHRKREWDEYKRATAPALAEYSRAVAPIVWEIISKRARTNKKEASE
jgi:hypothetical protein